MSVVCVSPAALNCKPSIIVQRTHHQPANRGILLITQARAEHHGCDQASYATPRDTTDPVSTRKCLRTPQVLYARILPLAGSAVEFVGIRLLLRARAGQGKTRCRSHSLGVGPLRFGTAQHPAPWCQSAAPAPLRSWPLPPLRPAFLPHQKRSRPSVSRSRSLGGACAGLQKAGCLRGRTDGADGKNPPLRHS
jgi:hypothetical protein